VQVSLSGRSQIQQFILAKGPPILAIGDAQPRLMIVLGKKNV